MDDKDNKVASTLADDDDLNTTAPSPRPEAWKMPEPVFRRTSGKLPRGFEKNYASPGSSSAETVSENDANENETSERVADSAGSAETSTTYVEPAPKHPTVKLVLVLLGLAAMIAFIVVFLTVVYFFFWRSS